jgi:hypothetical protein
MYPVRVICRGCPTSRRGVPVAGSNQVVYEFASIERKRPGKELEIGGVSGWAWSEIDIVDERASGATRAQRDALKLLAVMLQHTDTKPQQQRLLCRDPSARSRDNGTCDAPFLMINDLGLTFGHANLFNRNALGSANFEQWVEAPVWRSGEPCVGYSPKSWTGTLKHPVISEEGRRFLADLLSQPSDKQLRDLFEVARFEDRTGKRPVAVNEWVEVFKRKRSEIVNRTCPS